MSGDTMLTIIGNLTADPELRFTPSGAAVADFTVASTPRTFDKARNEWADGTTLFMRCSIWREAAENAAESLRKGMRVIAVGKLVQRSYQDRNGVDRTVVEMVLDEVGPSLKRAKAQVVRTQPVGQQPQGGYQQPQQYAPQSASDDPWRTQGQPQPQPPQAAPQQQAGWGPEQGFPQQQHPTDPPF